MEDTLLGKKRNLNLRKKSAVQLRFLSFFSSSYRLKNYFKGIYNTNLNAIEQETDAKKRPLITVQSFL